MSETIQAGVTPAHTVYAPEPAIQASQFALLTKVVDILNRQADVDRMLHDVLDILLTDADILSGAIYLVEPEGQLQLAVQAGITDIQGLTWEHFWGYRTLMYQALDFGETRLVPLSFGSDRLAGHMIDQPSAMVLVCTPLIVSGVRLGLIAATLAHQGLATNWVVVLQILGWQISQAIKQNQLANRIATIEQRHCNLMLEVDAIVCEMDVSTGYFTFVSPHAEELLGYPIVQWYTEQDFWPTLVHVDDREQVIAAWKAALHDNRRHVIEHRVVAADGRIIWMRDIIRGDATNQGKVQQLRGLINDITDQKRLEAQFYQAQKMEALGRLTSSVAHDFNNLLTAITGYSEFLLDALEQTNPCWSDADQIRYAAARAAQLTRQLLASSRQHIVAPQVLDLNSIVTSMSPLLQRLVGEDIDLVIALDRKPGRVKADPGQLEQVLLNLVVNARDAMPNGGKITLETMDVQLDSLYSGQYRFADPGQYVLLMVTDTGTGMSAQVRAHIFEPFFTTKAPGRGTGLGLSTVLGIIRQCGGDVFVDSKPGQGTTFKIYLPYIDHMVDLSSHELMKKPLQGSETVLLVEDEESVCTLVQKILQRYGYHVLVARDGTEALAVAESHVGRIDLLLTDVVMPGMRGTELAECLSSFYDPLRVVYMSGYTDTMIMYEGILDTNAVLIQKPFTPDELAMKLRTVLDA